MGSQLSVIIGNERRLLSDTSLNNPFAFTDAELQQYTGEAYRYYYMIMVTEGEGYFEAPPLSINSVANQSSYSLAAITPEFFAIRAVERQASYGTVPLSPSERLYRTNYTVGIGSGDAYFPRYRLQSLNLIFEPTPVETLTNAFLLRYYYVPAFPTATSLGTFQFDANFSFIYEPMIQYRALLLALNAKEGAGGVTGSASFGSELEQWESRFLSSLNRFDYQDEIQYSGFNYASNYWNNF